ncbi:MAG: sigma-54-dependent Fis family transcriptional regulator, partial [Mycobacterium sp.]
MVAHVGDIGRARERFLCRTSAVELHVSRTILASWQRSRENHINIDRTVVPYSEDWDGQSPLLASSKLVLDTLQEQLGGEAVSMILTDKSGLVLDRRVTHHDLIAGLDAVSLAPGFSYAERFAGTNGIGTAINCGESVLIDGRAHYTEDLGQFSCAGVPIRHPIRGTLLGVFDLTAWTDAPGTILMALAKATAHQIEEEISARSGRRELALFQAYMKVSQHSGAPILAMNGDALMMNDHLRMALSPDEQRSITEHAADMLHSEVGVTARTVELPGGRRAHLRHARVGSGAEYAGGVFHVRLLHSEVHRPPHRALIRGIRSSPTPPGLVGSSSAWTRCVEQVRACYEAGGLLALTGESGVGKLSLLRAVQLQHNPTHDLRVFDPPAHCGVEEWLSELSEALSRESAMIVIAHADQLDDQAAAAVIDQVHELGSDDDPNRRVRVAITVAGEQALDARFATAFSRTIEVPPLRHRIEDLTELIAHFLAQLAGDTRLSISDQAVAQLGRLDWPGNVTQLRKLLTDVLRLR